MANPFLDEGNEPKYSKQAQLESTRQKTLESQKNALRSIYTSENVGVSTAEELMDQGEKLDRANQMLDDISEKQKISDKHIRNLKSGFLGNLVGLFKKKEVPIKEEPKTYETYRNPELNNMVVNHKGTVRKDFDNSNTGVSNYQKEFDQNLDEMSHGVSRLNNVAKGLGAELERQNKLLDDMNPKTERINSKMTDHNKQLNFLLHGKPK